MEYTVYPCARVRDRPRVADISLDQFQAKHIRQVLLFSRAEIADSSDRIAARQRCARERAPNETGNASDEVSCHNAVERTPVDTYGTESRWEEGMKGARAPLSLLAWPWAGVREREVIFCAAQFIGIVRVGTQGVQTREWARESPIQLRTTCK